jgi:hypothetical protein
MGVLIMSDDRARDWTKLVRKIMQSAELPCPYETFFGNGDTADELSDLKDYVTRLEDRGATTIVVVPLLTSPYSRTYKQWRYLLGVGMEPGYRQATFFPVKPHANIQFVDPLNDSAAVVEILLDRAQEISTNPQEESVIVVAKGPADRDDNAGYARILRSVAIRLQERGNFKSVESFAMRDEAPAAVKEYAMQDLRSRIDSMNRNGLRVLLVPLLLNAEGLEHRLGLELRGLSYAFNTKPLFPDSRISEWIRSQIP